MSKIKVKDADPAIINSMLTERVKQEELLKIVNQKIDATETPDNVLSTALKLIKANFKNPYTLNSDILGILFLNDSWEAIQRILNGEEQYPDRDDATFHVVNPHDFFKQVGYKIGEIVAAYGELPDEVKENIWNHLVDYELWQYDDFIHQWDEYQGNYPASEDVAELQELCDFSKEIVDNGLYVSEETMETINTISENIEKIEIVYFLITLIMEEFAKTATHEKTLLEKEREQILKRLNKINSFLTLINN